MARALGMNPRKLRVCARAHSSAGRFRLASSSKSVTRSASAAIARDRQARGADPRSRKPSTGSHVADCATWGLTTDLEPSVPELVRDPAWQFTDLACYLVNLADELQQWLVHGTIDPRCCPR